MLFSELATARQLPDGRPLEVSFIDIRKAYFNGIPRRNLHLFLPREAGLGPKAVAHLLRCVYGTRDAGMIWEDCYSQALVNLGFRRGIANPCCFYHAERQMSVVVHGDDFTALGARGDLLYLEDGLSKVFEIKIKGHLGEAEDCQKEVRVLNRIVRIDSEGVPYEADPRHVELLGQSLQEKAQKHP